MVVFNISKSSMNSNIIQSCDFSDNLPTIECLLCCLSDLGKHWKSHKTPGRLTLRFSDPIILRFRAFLISLNHPPSRSLGAKLEDDISVTSSNSDLMAN